MRSGRDRLENAAVLGALSVAAVLYAVGREYASTHLGLPFGAEIALDMAILGIAALVFSRRRIAPWWFAPILCAVFWRSAREMLMLPLMMWGYSH